MKRISVRFALICVCLAVAIQMSIGIGYAEIDPQSIVGIWLLDEGQGDVAADMSGNENDGEIVGAQWTDGKFGQALEFDGVSHVAIPSSKTTDDYIDGFTYLLWIKPTAPPSNGSHTRVMERDWHNPTIQIGAADFCGSIARGGDQAATHVRGGAWVMDEWSFVALTYDGDTLQLHVDGEMVGEKDVGEPDLTNGADGGAIWLARWKNPGWDFTGILDEVAAFNVPLSVEDLEDIMNNGLEMATAVSSLGKMAATWGHIKNMSK
jgi:hypothetical protein